MRLLLAVLCISFLGGCTGGRKSYPNDLATKNVSVRPALAGVKGSLHIHSVDAQCKTEYLGTLDLDRPALAVGVAPERWTYLVFDFSSSSLLRGSREVSQAALLRARDGHAYEVDVSYRDDIYNVVLRERPPRGGMRELPLLGLAACPVR